jgi:hypothetical protein
VFGRENPRIENGEIGWDDGEEEEKDSDDLWNVKRVMGLQEVGEDDKANHGCAYNDAGYCLCPGFAIAGKHKGSLSSCLIEAFACRFVQIGLAELRAISTAV